jgi:hypothetical protein
MVLLSACNGGTRASTGQPPAAAAPTTPTNLSQPSVPAVSATQPAAAAAVPSAQPAQSGGSATTGGPSPSAAPTVKVDANKASISELQQAFEAAGISNAARWAREVDEYRPYPTDDPSFAKLRGELAKYNPGADTVNKIIATLSL